MNLKEPHTLTTLDGNILMAQEFGRYEKFETSCWKTS